MKKSTYLLWIIMFVTSLSTFSQAIPKRPDPPRLVNDFVGLFSPEEATALEQKLVALDDTTSIQIALVVVPELYGYDANSLGQQIGESWGVGQKGKNNGVVILIKPRNGNERGYVSIQTGYGMEAPITDALCKRIVELEMIPEFKQNNPFAATNKAIDAIMLASKGMYKAEPKKNKQGSSSGAIIIIMIIIIIIISMFNRKNKTNHKTLGRSDVPFWLLMGGMSGGSRGSGWGNFSSGSGSFGGFGGGSFGGGGASGSW